MSSNEVRYRKAVLADAGALTSCIDAAYARYKERIPDLPPVSEGIEDEIANYLVWIAAEGDNVVAGLILIPQNACMKVANLAVHPNHAGKGIARKLMAIAEREAARLGFGEMRLNTHADMPENVSLYGHLGWEVFAREGNTVSMRKALPRA